MDDRVLAVAAGHEITKRELDSLIANYPAKQQAYFSNPKAKDELLEQLIGFYLFSKLAEEQHIRESREYQETLAKMGNELASHMAATGVMNQVTVDEAEAKSYFDAHPSQFQGETRFSDIKEQLSEKLLQQKKQEVYFKTVQKLEAKYGVERKY